jgi:ribulose 1,5-bisphosphate synthetase/thiazole synthase
MATVRQSAREVPVIAEADVLVVGNGPGGLGAALAKE